MPPTFSLHHCKSHLRRHGASAVLGALLIAAPAKAYGCLNGPGYMLTPCTYSARQGEVYNYVLTWEGTRIGSEEEEDFYVSDTYLRYGLQSRTELIASWAPFTASYVLSNDTGQRRRLSDVGDMSIGVKHSFLETEGAGVSAAFATIVGVPLGRRDIGAPGWSIRAQAPVAFSVSRNFSIVATPELAREAIGAGDYHFGYGAAAGLTYETDRQFAFSAELRMKEMKIFPVQQTISLAASFETDDGIELNLWTEWPLDRGGQQPAIAANLSFAF